MNRVYLLSLLFYFAYSSCTESPDEGFIDPEFQPYVNKFIAEAALRGDTIDIDQSGLSIIFEDDGSTNDYAGVCRNRFGLGSNEIGIERGFWDDSAETIKEWVLFHELGHCVLGRDHDNEKFENGMWKSLMRGGSLTGIDSRIPLCYIWDRQEYYLDELFDPDVEAPKWVKKIYQYDEKPRRGEELISLQAGTETFDNYLITPILNFELEYTFARVGSGFNTNIIYGDAENIEYHFVGIDQGLVNELYIGNENQSCIRTRFEDQVSNKVTIRQKGEVTTVFINEEFVHSFPSYSNPITRFRKTGEADIVFNSFKLWSII